MEQVPRIVIVGGGVAGLELATKLADRLGRAGKAEVTLVDRSSAHAWKPMLHAFAAGTAQPRQHRVSFLDHARRHHFRFWPGEMCGLDRASRMVKLASFLLPDGKTELPSCALGYDVLVITAGSRTNDWTTPGVAEHCIYIDDLRDAELLNRRLVTELLLAIAERKAMNFVIVGAGATGVELAAELSRSFDIAAAYGAEIVRSLLKVTLIDRDQHILAGLPDVISNAADPRLRRAGVEIVTDTGVRAVHEREVELADGRKLNADITVWAAGVKGPAFPDGLDGLGVTSAGLLMVGPTLQTLEDERIFALGDCARLNSPSTGKSLPQTAQVARQQARHLARQLPAWLAGEPMQPFHYRDRGILVSLAGYDAFGIFGRRGALPRRFIRGRLAQLSYAMLYRLHQIEVHGFWRGILACLADGFNRLAFPRIRFD
jgi:NADH:ubiquinone reductase (H+-translocating)